MSRDKTITKFSYKAFRDLKKRLGEFDAIVECNELAIREFLSVLESSADKNLHIQKLSAKHKVRVDTVNLKLFAPRIRQFYVTSVMQQAEQFIEEFIIEYKGYNNNWENKVDGETDFDCLLRNIYGTTGNGIRQIGEEVYHGFEYYRLVRNRFAHSESKDLKLLDNHCKKIAAYYPFYNSNFVSVGCPNTYSGINLNDFLLCTNIIKNIGYTLCEKCKPDNSKLADHILKLEIKTDNKRVVKPLKSILKLKNNAVRFEKAIENLLNSTFGRINSVDRKEILNHIEKTL
jgi:hypothetical protein